MIRLLPESRAFSLGRSSLLWSNLEGGGESDGLTTTETTAETSAASSLALPTTPFSFHS